MACVRDTPVILDVSSIMFVSCGFYVCSLLCTLIFKIFFVCMFIVLLIWLPKKTLQNKDHHSRDCFVNANTNYQGKLCMP